MAPGEDPGGEEFKEFSFTPDNPGRSVYEQSGSLCSTHRRISITGGRTGGNRRKNHAYIDKFAKKWHNNSCWYRKLES
jgi:hypothetical protein